MPATDTTHSLTPIPARTVFKEATPVALSYVPFAVLYGALAQSADLSLFQTLAMSLFVYSGATQLLAVQMLAAGATHIGIVVAATVLTVRHVLMGASLALFTRRLPPMAKLLLSPLMTDESFALSWKRYQIDKRAHSFFLGTNLYLYLTWNVASAVGHTAGQAAPVLMDIGLDLVFPLLFSAILVGIISTRVEAVATGAGLLFALAIRGYIPTEWSIPLTGLVAAAVGVSLERRGGAVSR